MTKPMKLSTFKLFKTALEKHRGSVILNNEQLRAMQKVVLEIALDVIGVCDKHNIEYQLSAGSVLGAWRHQGFIPWDDDIDIIVPRSDITHLANCIREEFPDKYCVHTPWDTDGYALGMVQIRRKGTIARGRDDIRSEECGIYIDVFICDNVPDNRLHRNLKGVYCMGLDFIVSCTKLLPDKEFWLDFFEADPAAQKVIKRKILLAKLFSFKTAAAWNKLADRAHSYEKGSATRYVTNAAGPKHYFGEMLERQCMYPSKELEFEGKEMKVPGDTEAYLANQYGQYWVIPPESDRERHVVFEFDLGPYEDELRAN